METNTHVLFYGHKPEKIGYWMSNFWPCIFKDEEGITYNCSEQYFMYKKADLFDPENTKLKNQILTETDPHKIKAYGRKVKNYDDNRWTQCSFQVMFEANFYKFTQNSDLANKLIMTGNKTLVEASPSDGKWGAGKSAKQIIKDNYQFTGNNWLGQVLEMVRNNLKNNV